MAVILSAFALYVLTTRFSPGSESTFRWKVVGIAAGWILIARITDPLLAKIVGSAEWIYWRAIVARLAIMLVLVWLCLVHWCKIERNSARGTAVAFGGFVLLMGVMALVIMRTVA
jgi:hypothetical protein